MKSATQFYGLHSKRFQHVCADRDLQVDLEYFSQQLSNAFLSQTTEDISVKFRQ